MIDRIQAQMAANGRVSDYTIMERKKSGQEWYLIKADLDCARSVETTLYDVAIHVDSGDGPGRTRGMCSLLLHPTAPDGEIRRAIDRAVETAAGMGNPWYPLPEKSADAPLAVESAFEAMDPGVAMECVRRALYARDGLDGATINSLELFLSRKETRVVTSRGVDAAWTSHEGFAEFVVNAGPPGRDEVELFSEIHFSDLDEERLSEATGRLLRAARDRLAAVPTPACAGIPLLLSGHLAAQVYGYWFDNLWAGAVYDKVANFALGDSVGSPGGSGDRVTMRAVPMVRGSTKGGPWDSSGFLLKPVPCIRDDMVVGFVASRKYAHYLSCQPSGVLSLFELDPGTRSGKELRAADHLEILAFSDFFVDGTTGDFGGEVRLGYLVRDGKRLCVRGGSVTGTMGDNRGRILLSRELEATVLALAPSACVIPVVSVTPAE